MCKKQICVMDRVHLNVLMELNLSVLPTKQVASHLSQTWEEPCTSLSLTHTCTDEILSMSACALTDRKAAETAGSPWWGEL